MCLYRLLLLTASLACLLPPTQLEAQQLLVQLQDNVTRQPIANAYFQTEDGQRGVANAQGEFFVSTGSGTMATRFSHLAYQDTLIDLRANQQIYFLSPASPFNAVSLDKVRLGYDYLDPSRLNDYNYRLVDTQLVNNVFCYHLQFRPVNDQPTRYFGANKNHYTGVFSGDIYLSLEDNPRMNFPG